MIFYVKNCALTLRLPISRYTNMRFDVKKLDLYRKIPKDLTQSTYTGAAISICCMVFMTVLFLSEFFYFYKPNVVSELFVDNPENSEEKIPVRLNVTLPRIECKAVGLDIQDDMGRHEVGFLENTVREPVEDGKGCHFEASFLINKVPGNFHVSTHSADAQPETIDFAHEIHGLNFGAQIDNVNIPGNFNSLAGRSKVDANSMESHDYIMKIVPSVYEDVSGNKVQAYQYTFAYRSYVSFSHGGRIIPALWFRYDLTPITVKYHEKRPPLYTFLTTICAIIGGTFTVAGIIDTIVFSGMEIIKKMEIGKLS